MSLWGVPVCVGNAYRQELVHILRRNYVGKLCLGCRLNERVKSIASCPSTYHYIPVGFVGSTITMSDAEGKPSGEPKPDNITIRVRDQVRMSPVTYEIRYCVCDPRSNPSTRSGVAFQRKPYNIRARWFATGRPPGRGIIWSHWLFIKLKLLMKQGFVLCL